MQLPAYTTGASNRPGHLADGVLCERVTMKYAWINDHRDEFPVKAMCKVFQVSRSGFYKSLHVQPSEPFVRGRTVDKRAGLVSKTVKP